MRIKFSRIIAAVFIFISACSHWLLPSVFEGTLISTSKGLVFVERLKVGDKVTSCKTDGTLLEVPIKNIHKFSQNKAHRIFLRKVSNSSNFAEERYIYAPPTQELYDPFLRQWFKAEQIATHNWLMNDQLNVFPVEYIDCVSLNVSEYHIELDDPHVLFISNCSYTPNAPHHLHDHMLIHNFIPGVASSFSYADAGGVLLKAVENTHPVVKAVVGLTAAGLFLYEMFKGDTTKKEEGDTTKKEEQPQIWQLNNMPQQGGGNQPSQGSNNQSPQQKPNPNNQKQNQKPSIIGNEKEIRDPNHNNHKHIFEKNWHKHEFYKVGKDLNNLAHRQELIDKAIEIIELGRKNGKLPQQGPFKLRERLYGNHLFEVRGAVVNHKPVIATYFHVSGCC